MAVPQSYALAGHITQSDITVSIDYNDAGAVDPDSGLVFYGQVDVDRFLYEKGAINFKHIMAFWEALPTSIAHVITLNLAEGDHYPRSSDTYIALDFRNKLFVGGEVIVNGGSPSTYVALDGYLEDLIPASIQTGSNDPYMTFSGTPFTSFDLRGYYAVLDTGQATLIHDHDNSTLYLIDELSPTPTSVTVARPSTRFLNDDGLGSRLATLSALWVDGTPDRRGGSYTQFEFNDLVIAQYGASYGVFSSQGNTYLTRLVLDNTIGPSEAGIGFTVAGSNAAVQLFACSRIASIGTLVASMPYYVAGGSSGIYSTSNYAQGGKDGVVIKYSREGSFYAIGLILNQVGDVSLPVTERASVTVANGRLRFSSPGSRDGKHNEIRNGTVPGILLIDGGYDRGTSHGSVTFKGLSAPCVLLSGASVLDLTVFGTEKFIDGGGNTDVGIQIDGPYARVKLNSLTDVSGSIGDVRMADGDIWSYTLISSYGPVTDSEYNIVEVL